MHLGNLYCIKAERTIEACICDDVMDKKALKVLF